MGIFTVVFEDDAAWLIFDRCRRAYVASARGGEQRWTTYDLAATACATLNQNHGVCVNGVERWSDLDQDVLVLRTAAD